MIVVVVLLLVGNWSYHDNIVIVAVDFGLERLIMVWQYCCDYGADRGLQLTGLRLTIVWLWLADHGEKIV